ncbi:antitoxin [bacterium 1XD42-1]|nr:antitoxin [bacterium 1XD42-8]RKJ62634.1 antitoxin [bacterium 1XD42-1]
MGKTSSVVKDRYNAKVYDEIKVRVNKGKKEIIRSHAMNLNESVNSFINRAITETIERDKAKENQG